MQVTDEMVGRFISWELPADFKSRRIGYLYKVTHPLGMDLLATDEARAMLEHVLGGEPEREPVEQEGGTWTNYFTAQKIEAERDALREALTTLLREHDSAPDAKGSDGWDAARKLLEGE